MLKHKKEELNPVQLDSHLRIEEYIRAQENDKSKGKDVAGPSSVNMVEEHKNNKNNNKFKGTKRMFKDTNDKSNKKHDGLEMW